MTADEQQDNWYLLSSGLITPKGRFMRVFNLYLTTITANKD